MMDDPDQLTTGSILASIKNIKANTRALDEKCDMIKDLAERTVKALSKGGILHKDTLDHTKKLESLVKGLDDAIKELEKARNVTPQNGKTVKDIKSLLDTIVILIQEIDDEKRLIAGKFSDELKDAMQLTVAIGSVLNNIKTLRSQAIDLQKRSNDKKQMQTLQEFVDSLDFIIQNQEKIAAMVQMIEVHTRTRLNSYWQKHYIPHIVDLEKITQKIAEEMKHPSDLIDFKALLSEERNVVEGINNDQSQLKNNITSAASNMLNTIHDITKQKRSFELLIMMMDKMAESVEKASRWIEHK